MNLSPPLDDNWLDLYYHKPLLVLLCTILVSFRRHGAQHYHWLLVVYFPRFSYNLLQLPIQFTHHRFELFSLLLAWAIFIDESSPWRFFYKFYNIYWKSPVVEFLINKVADFQAWRLFYRISCFSRVFNTVVFLRRLRNLWKHLF